MKLRCETCEYYQPLRYSQRRGLCRIHPPILYLADDLSRGLWPEVTGEKDWCGEWQRKVSDHESK